MANSEASFGPFRFDRDSRVLTRADVPVHLGSRALAILDALVEIPGRLVSKAELFERAWPGLRVEEANLKVQISGLRKALGEHGGAIRAEASLGYRFVAKVATDQPIETSAARQRSRAPRLAGTPIGREQVARDICDRLKESRLLTILGPGGIGKTTVALMVAEALDRGYADGVYFVDLGRMGADAQVPAAVQGALDFTTGEEPDIDQVLLALRGRHAMLILDSCEHATATVAQLAERLLAEAENIDVLVTTRETLRIAGECVWSLDPLETPPVFLRTTAADVEGFSAVQLFARIVRQRQASFEVVDETAAAVSEICRRLDGIPLAIELAASQVDVLGVDEVRRGLDERFALLSVDRRAGIPRQRSMAATIDWSYGLLSAEEQAVLRRLACFAGPFTLQAAMQVATDAHLDPGSVRDAIVALANKSLLRTSHDATRPEYRLLETTRAYALRALGPPDELGEARARHARHFLTEVEQIDWDVYQPGAHRARLRDCADEVRLALDWAFEADVDVAVRLTLAAETLWVELGGLSDGLRYLKLALHRGDAIIAADAMLKARVLVALATRANSLREANEPSLCETALQAAREVGDSFLMLRALHALGGQMLSRVRPSNDRYFREFESIADETGDISLRQLPIFRSAYIDVENSNIISARQKFEHIVSHCSGFPRPHALYFGRDPIMACKTTLALIKFWMGAFDDARASFWTLLETMQDTADAASLCFVLAHGAIWCELEFGDLERAELYLDKLEALVRQYQPWTALADAFRALLTIAEHRDGAVEAEHLQAAVRTIERSLQAEQLKREPSMATMLMLHMVDAQISLGQVDEAERTLETLATFRRDDDDARVVVPHARLRARMLMARDGLLAADRARSLLVGAIRLARRRSIFFFELESTLDLTNLELACGRVTHARSLVTAFMERLEGRDVGERFGKALAQVARACGEPVAAVPYVSPDRPH